MKVQNMTSNRSGREIANQFIIYAGDGDHITYFQSYRSIIVKIDNYGVTTLDKFKWNCSKTTGKYRNRFLGETKKETEKKIASGEYKLADLNA